MKLKADCSELVQFGKKLTNKASFQNIVRQALKQSAKQFLIDVKKVTPKTGEYNPKTGNTWHYVRSGHAAGELRNAWDLDNTDIVVKKASGGYQLWLVNNTEYASWVEEGHTKWLWGVKTDEWVIGSFFLKDTENLYQNGKLDLLVERQIQTWLEGIVNGQ